MEEQSFEIRVHLLHSKEEDSQIPLVPNVLEKEMLEEMHLGRQTRWEYRPVVPREVCAVISPRDRVGELCCESPQQAAGGRAKRSREQRGPRGGGSMVRPAGRGHGLGRRDLLPPSRGANRESGLRGIKPQRWRSQVACRFLWTERNVGHTAAARLQPQTRGSWPATWGNWETVARLSDHEARCVY